MSFSTSLKEKTWDIHQRVEQAELNKKLFAPDLDLETYAQILKHFSMIFGPLEDAIASHEACVKVGYRNRLDLIKKDMKDLGLAEFEPKDGVQVPHIETDEEALGAAYVLEGSNMGAAFIRKRILETLGPDTFENGGLEFFSQTQSGKDWKAFKDRMDQFFEKKSDNAREAALTAARDTFLAFEQSFNQFEHSSTK